MAFRVELCGDNKAVSMPYRDGRHFQEVAIIHLLDTGGLQTAVCIFILGVDDHEDRVCGGRGARWDADNLAEGRRHSQWMLSISTAADQEDFEG